MAFKDLINEIQDRPCKCKVALLVEDMTEEDRADAEAVMEPESGFSGATIARAITASTGVSISASAVNLHRKGDCPCRSQMR